MSKPATKEDVGFVFTVLLCMNALQLISILGIIDQLDPLFKILEMLL